MERRPKRRILYAGTYERGYPRNAITIAALRHAGFDVRECHRSLWERFEDKSRRLDPLAAALLLGRLVATYLALIPAFCLALRPADVVMIGYIGQLDMLLLGPIAKLARRALVFNPLVTLTDTVVEDRQLIRPGSAAARLIALLDRLALRLADLILVDTAENGAYLTERFGVASGRVAVVPVGADQRVFRPEARGADDRSAADRDLEVLFYGKMIPLHGAETIVRAAALLEPDGGYRFRLIGNGQTLDATRQLARNLALTNVEFVPRVPYGSLPMAIERSDVVLGIFGGGDKAARVVPNKVYQAMAMGAAIVTRDSPAIRRVLQDGQSALQVPPADPEALAEALRRLRDPERRAQLGEAARAAFDRAASLDALAGSLHTALATIPGDNAGRLALRGSR